MKSKLFVIGKPIKHSRSPTIHNFWIEKYSLNASYNKLEVDETEIKGLIQQVRDGKIQGLNITIPYKKIMTDSNQGEESCSFAQQCCRFWGYFRFQRRPWRVAR